MFPENCDISLMTCMLKQYYKTYPQVWFKPTPGVMQTHLISSVCAPLHFSGVSAFLQIEGWWEGPCAQQVSQWHFF